MKEQQTKNEVQKKRNDTADSVEIEITISNVTSRNIVRRTTNEMILSKWRRNQNQNNDNEFENEYKIHDGHEFENGEIVLIIHSMNPQEAGNQEDETEETRNTMERSSGRRSRSRSKSSSRRSD